MRRFIAALIVPAFCAGGLWGCGPSANTIAGKPKLKRDEPQDFLADNPLRERSDARRTQWKAEEKSAARAETKSEAAALAKFDKETLTLIEEELVNTPPEEREQFYKDVISLQPAMVRQIIHTRRIVRQVGQDAPSRLASADSPAGGNRPIRQTSGVEYSDLPMDSSDPNRDVSGYDPARDAGLGAADPWNRQTQSPSPQTSGGWTNDPNRPPTDLPFGQIPAMSGTGHSASYTPGTSDQRSQDNGLYREDGLPPRIQPPPGGAQSPVGQARETDPRLPKAPPAFSQNARVPNDYNPQSPPVPNYNQNGSDPFGAGNASPVRTASSNPNQPLPGIGGPNGFNDAFPSANGAGAGSSPSSSVFASNADLARLIESLEAELKTLRFAEQIEPAQKTAYVQKHVYLRMLYLMAGQEARAVTAIPDVPPADQEFWQQTFWAMSNYFDVNAMPDSEYRATQTIAQLRTAIQKLQENARLELRNVAFCHKISSFGNFDRFPQDEFGPGQPVLVYAEVANFKSKPATLPQKPNEMLYRTQLKSSIEIHRLGPAGELVERFDFEPTEDYCHNHRRDYFHSYEFTIPQRISLGPHVMTLTVEDQLSRKIATYRLNFMVK